MLRLSPFWNVLALLIVLAASLVSSPAIAEPAPILFGVISNAEPSRVYPKWQPLADFIAEQTGRPVKIVIPRGFDKLTEVIDKGEVDIFYVNSYVYYRLQEKGKAVPLAQMQNLNGSVLSRSIVVVRGDSGITSLNQLKGEKVAFVSKMGAGGYLAPRALFYKEGIPTKEMVQEEFTQNLPSSIHKVLLGEVKAASMCGLNFKLLSEKLDTGELKTLVTSDDYAEDVIGARPGLAPEVQQAVMQAILQLDQSDKGRQVIAGMRELKVQKFVPYDAQKSEPVTRHLIEQAKM
jgi:phosphonate transport system substrate-binding protein